MTFASAPQAQKDALAAVVDAGLKAGFSWSQIMEAVSYLYQHKAELIAAAMVVKGLIDLFKSDEPPAPSPVNAG